MDLQQLLDRVQQHLRSLRWNAQTVALLLLACFALLGIIAVQRPLATGSHETLFEGRRLTSSELQQIEAALGKTDLTHIVENGEIKVPRQLRGKCLAALQEANCLPQSFHAATRDALSRGSTFETWRKSQQRMHHALEQEARLAICELQGVEDAFVFFDEKSDRSSFQRNQRATAVVGVRTAPDQPLDLQLDQVIRDMLLGFKTELTGASITITDLNSRQAFRGSPSELGSSGYQMLIRQGLEREWKRKIENALSFVPEAQVNVRVVPDEAGAQAESVRVSVGIPSTYVNRIQPTATQTESDAIALEIRQKIQSTIQPLLPEAVTSEPAPELVAVNVFDVAAEPRTNTAEWPANMSKSLITMGFLIAFLLSGVFLFMSVGHPREAEPNRSLRVYSSEQDTGKQPSQTREQLACKSRQPETESPATKLRAYVEEDPAAAAQSLSDFIDRAS